MTRGKVIGVNGNMVSVEADGPVILNEVAYVLVADRKLKAEVIKIKGNEAEMQVFEITTGISVNDEVEFSQELLVAHLGPGILGQIYDGLQNPLPELAADSEKKYGKKNSFFLERGMYLDSINKNKKWEFNPTAKIGDKVTAGDELGFVNESIFKHKIMVPFGYKDYYTVKNVISKKECTVDDEVAIVEGKNGETLSLKMSFTWPVKMPIKAYKEKLKPSEQMVTKVRIIDAFLPIAKGGTYCIPGPFGAGKTVLQQVTSRNAEVDIVIVAACGERAGEVVETLKEFPELKDPKTGKTLMERTVIIANTSSMPVAAREASVYTAVTLAEYYRQMGLDVLVLADSTSRWAQAMREMSGRLEEIPGEEAFPAYLESVIASFYERAGLVELRDGSKGSVTIGGTVSPAGGNFEEPVTQATLKVVGAFHGLSYDRSYARKYPAINPLESWSKYKGCIDERLVSYVKKVMVKGDEVNQMMKVIGEEGTGTEDYITYLKGDLIDEVYLQQNSFDKVDEACPVERQKDMFKLLLEVVGSMFNFSEKDEARGYFHILRQNMRDWNTMEFESANYNDMKIKLIKMIEEKSSSVDSEAEKLKEIRL